MKRLAIITENERVYEKVRLLCEGEFFVLSRATTPPDEHYDVAVCEGECGAKMQGRVIRIEPRFSLEELKVSLATLAEGEEDSLAISEKESTVILKGKKIKLTETELRALRILFDSEGFVEREKILRSVFGESASESAVNVYIHYLREKLESGGERVIISSRQNGYKIDEKWRRVRC